MTCDSFVRSTAETPHFITGVADESVHDGGELRLRVRADGVPRPELRWLVDGRQVREDARHLIATTTEPQVVSELTVTGFTSQDGGQYSCVAGNCVGDVETTARVTLAMIMPCFERRLDRAMEISEGDFLELNARVDGSPLPTATWFKDGIPIDEKDPRIVTSATADGLLKLRIEDVTADDSGAYRLVISNAVGETLSQCALAVDRRPFKPTFTQGLKDTRAVVGESMRLEAHVAAYPPAELRWYKDGLAMRAQSGYLFETPPDGRAAMWVENVEPEDPGVYTLVATNTLGEATTAARVFLEERPRRPEFIIQLRPVTAVEGFPVLLEVRATGCPTPDLHWLRNGIPLYPDNKHVTVTALPDGTGTLLLDKCTPADTKTYAAVASNASGEADTSCDVTVASRVNDALPEERPQFITPLRDAVTDEGVALHVEATFTGNPVPEVEWTRDARPLDTDHRVVLTCDGRKVGLCIQETAPSDTGEYVCKLKNKLGSDACDARITVRKIYSAPVFTSRFQEQLRQAVGADGKLAARVSGVPQPLVAWYKDGQPVQESLKYHVKRDGESHCLYVRELNEEDAGEYTCHASNKEGSAECNARLTVVDVM